jgi:hypothetical protein
MKSARELLGMHDVASASASEPDITIQIMPIGLGDTSCSSAVFSQMAGCGDAGFEVSLGSEEITLPEPGASMDDEAQQDGRKPRKMLTLEERRLPDGSYMSRRGI